MIGLFIGCLAGMASAGTAGAQDRIGISLEPYVAEGLLAPVAGAHAGDGSGRMFIAEQIGRVRVIENGTLLSEPFLDIRRQLVRLAFATDERGLLGLAFHPEYAENGRFFVYYSAPGGPGNHQSVLSEFRVSADDPNVAGPDESVLLRVDQPQANHNGGQLAFGPDGMLYLGLGDGGGANDEHGRIGNGQDTTNLLGTIIRIDVDGGESYAIPPDNPFANGGGEPEIWAYGLRNPWRFSFDRATGRLFCADVGQNRLEEINIIEGGGNYGWRIMEGTECFNPRRDCDTEGLILPIADYPRSMGISVTGGYVYRGNSYSSLYGRYLFADWTGPMYYLTESGGGWEMDSFRVDGGSGNSAGMFVTSFAEDEAGELYVLGNEENDSPNRAGKMLKITVPGDEPVNVDGWRLHGR